MIFGRKATDRGISLFFGVFLGVFCGLLLLVCGGCSVRQRVNIGSDSSADISISIHLERLLLRYLADIAGVEPPTLTSIGLFDPVAIAASLQGEKGLTLTHARMVGDDGLELGLQVADISALVATEERQAILEIERAADRQFLRLNLTPQNVRRALELIIGDPLLIELFLPADSQMSAEQYSEYIGWALEEYAPRATISEMLRASQVQIVISADGQIVEQAGGMLANGMVHISVPIVQLITLSSPLTYSVTIADE